MARGSYIWNEKSLFVNPYNFVSSDFSQKTKADLKKEKHTGVLKCHLITKTPVAIPLEIIEETRVGEKLNQTHKTYEFFNYGEGKYVIPGSSIRGAVRSVYEAITDSCYVTADEEELITKRSNSAYKAGVLIRKGAEWKLYPATRYIFKSNDYAKYAERKNFQRDQGCYDEICFKDLKKEISFGDMVSFDVSRDKEGKEKGYYKNGYLVGYYAKNIRRCSENVKANHKGYLYLGEYIYGKHFESIFQTEDAPISIDRREVEHAKINLEETIRLYNDPAVNRNRGNREKEHSGYKDYVCAEQNGVIPLWYQFDEKRKKLSLSMACLGRVAYQNTMGKLLKEKMPCTERKNLCKACALFGMASSEDAVGTRIRFTDAMIDKEDIKLEENGKLPKKTLEELASPKPSYLPFYLQKPDDGNGPINDYDSTKAELRGRKFYWHSENKKEKPANYTERNATMEVIENKKKGFQFSVFYDNISETQLKELIWVLTLGENSQESCRCYKIGHGKPIGLGSVKIIIDEQIERTYQDGYCLKKCNIETVEDVFPNSQRKKELLRIMTMGSVKNVRYPYVYGKGGTNAVAAHQWFGKNYKLGKKSPEYYLPEIMENNKLPSVTYTENNSNDNFSGQRGKKKR